MNDVIIPPVNFDKNEDALDKVVRKALQQIEYIIDIDINSVNALDRIKMLSIKKDAAASIINAGLKADENRFRRENKDIVERLFEKVRKESKIVDGHVIHKV